MSPSDCNDLSQIKKQPLFDTWYPWSPMGEYPLEAHTISTKALHKNGKNARYFKNSDMELREYELHNTFTLLEGIDTHTYLK